LAVAEGGGFIVSFLQTQTNLSQYLIKENKQKRLRRSRGRNRDIPRNSKRTDPKPSIKPLINIWSNLLHNRRKLADR
jgi:hypothetical protein